MRVRLRLQARVDPDDRRRELEFKFRLLMVGDIPKHVGVLGSEDLVESTENVLVLRLIKREPGDEPFDQWWAKYKAEEKQLEEAKYVRATRRVRQSRSAKPAA